MFFSFGVCHIFYILVCCVCKYPCVLINKFFVAVVLEITVTLIGHVGGISIRN